MGRSIFRIVAVLLMLRLSAFAAGAAGIWIDVPFIEQQKDGCGAAVIAMVMQYWQQHDGQPTDPSSDATRIFAALDSKGAHGIYAADMVRYFQQNGYRAFAFNGAWDDLSHHLAQGRPLIAALKPGPGLPFHYVVITGLDPDHHAVLLNDPAQRKLLKQDASQFEQQWKAADHWTLLAVPEVSAH